MGTYTAKTTCTSLFYIMYFNHSMWTYISLLLWHCSVSCMPNHLSSRSFGLSLTWSVSADQGQLLTCLESSLCHLLAQVQVPLGWPSHSGWWWIGPNAPWICQLWYEGYGLQVSQWSASHVPTATHRRGIARRGRSGQGQGHGGVRTVCYR